MKKLYILFISGMILLFVSACEDKLSELPKNEKVDKTVITDEVTAQTALNGVYYHFANIDRSANITSWSTHEVIPGSFSGYLGYGYGQIQEEMNINTGGFETGWNEAYECINAANGVIQGVEALPDDLFSGNRKSEILGESRFLRAYEHFRLLIYFGQWYDVSSEYGVLLREELSTLSNISKARSNVSDSYEAIINDLDYSIENAPEVNDPFYATRWTAMALKMRVLVSRGTQADLTEAITLADNIIQNGPYTLEANVKDIFYTLGLSSNEVMLGIKPQVNQEAYYYVRSRQYSMGASSFWVAKLALKDLLEGDPRQSWVVGPDNPYAFYGSFDTFYFTKFIAARATPTPLTETAYVLRLSEVYLLKAEAIIRSGGSLDNARDILKVIQGHAGVTDFTALDNAITPEDMRMQCFYETVRSLVGEDGAEWMALARLPFETVQLLKPTITQKFQFYYPIPTTELKNNPLFGPQNPGYQL